MTVGSITVFIALMNAPDSGERDLSSLQKCYSGGAPIAPSITEQFEEKFGVYIQIAYGLTESNSSTHATPLGDHAFLTGDVAVMDEDGWFYIVNRKKDMINVAGYKVWPREVEDVLSTHPRIKEATVVSVADEYRGEPVKAFVALKVGEEISEDDLISYCKERMADHKYPHQIEFLDELPKTATGKFLRRELRDEARAEA